MYDLPASSQFSSSIPSPYASPNAQILSAHPVGEPSGMGGGLKIFLVILFIALIGTGAYFLVSYVNTPVNIREKATLTQPVYENFKRNVTKISEHLEREPKGDADSFERYSEEGENLVSNAKKDKEQLVAMKDTITIAEMRLYSNYLGDYISKADELILLEEENVQLGRAVASYVREFQKQTTEMASAYIYIQSNPDRFLTSIDTFIGRMDRLIADLKKLELKSEMKDTFNAFIYIQQVELDSLKDIKSAVDSRSDILYANATQKYAATKKSADEDYNRTADKLEKKIRDLTDELDQISDKVNAQYQGLRNKYNF